MDQATWSSLTPAERAKQVDLSGLTPQLVGLEGRRVEVVTCYGETRRFKVGRSTGWRPCHIELHNARSTGGSPADLTYKAIRIIK